MDSDHIYLSAAIFPAQSKWSRVVAEWLKKSRALTDSFIDISSHVCTELYVCILLLSLSQHP